MNSGQWKPSETFHRIQIVKLLLFSFGIIDEHLKDTQLLQVELASKAVKRASPVYVFSSKQYESSGFRPQNFDELRVPTVLLFGSHFLPRIT